MSLEKPNDAAKAGGKRARKPSKKTVRPSGIKPGEAKDNLRRRAEWFRQRSGPGPG